ncbi:malate dehydrogenase [Alkalihalobacillus sp. 1P02AB]|uniref:malate dehydrogenase n=1 Tax=Alkalihalobacillus sp. 1P02AB TaxID=3132260 RepID=UPI0039A4AFDE
MKKISIIGAAGTLGASAAMMVALEDYADTLCLIDVNESLLDNHIMDFENAYPHKSIYRGEYSDLEGSSIIIITAGVPNRNDETSRDAYLQDNLKIFDVIGRNISKYAPNAIIITASNPVDVLNYYLHKKFSFKRNQLIGYTLNDSSRFAWAINKVLNQKEQLFSPVIGEHGETQVPVFSHVKKKNERFEIKEQEKKKIVSEIKSWFVKFNQLNVARTTGWTTGVGIVEVVKALSKKEESLIIGSSLLDGEYGLHDVSIGVPILCNQEGIQKVIEWELTIEEKRAFEQSAKKLTGLIEDIYHY